MKNLPVWDMEHKKRVSFSNTERGVVENIAKGFMDKEIAKRMNLSTGTIRNCFNTLKRKTNMNNRTQIALLSLVLGLIDIDCIME
jgi:DNA-binding NarL/FixJ family response regulator